MAMGYGSVFTHGKRQLKFHGVFYILNVKYQLHRWPATLKVMLKREEATRKGKSWNLTKADEPLIRQNLWEP